MKLILNFLSERKIKKYDEIFENIWFVEMEFLKKINYLTNVCPSGPGTTLIQGKRILEEYSLLFLTEQKGW
jgi:hypothetical protein